jgi:hypothetical protein
VSRSRIRPLLAAGAAAAITALVVLLVGAAGAREAPPVGHGVLSGQDRAELGAVEVRRGADPAPVDPAVDLTDPEAVARAYLAAAHTIRPGDAGRTQLRAAGYAVPGSPAAAVGVVVLDPPPGGQQRTATVTGLRLTAADASGGRRGYRAEVGTATGAPGGPQSVDLATSWIVLALQADGRWLVAADTPDLPSGED